MLLEWAYRDPGSEAGAAGGWFGRVVYAVDDATDGQVVLIEAWVASLHLQPVRT